MEFFIIYNVDSGQELIRGSGPDGTARAQNLGDDRGVIAISPDNFANQTPLLDLPVQEVKDSLWDFTKIIKSQMLVRGAQTDWGVVDSDAQSILNLQMKAGAAFYRTHVGDTRQMRFTMQDNQVVSITPGNALKLVGQAMTFLDDIHEYARDLRIALDFADTVQEVLAVDVFRGWPALQLNPT